MEIYSKIKYNPDGGPIGQPPVLYRPEDQMIGRANFAHICEAALSWPITAVDLIIMHRGWEPLRLSFGCYRPMSSKV